MRSANLNNSDGLLRALQTSQPGSNNYIYVIYICMYMESALGLLIPLSLDMKSQVREMLYKKNTHPKSLGRWSGKDFFFLFSFCCSSQDQHFYFTFSPHAPPPHIYIYINQLSHYNPVNSSSNIWNRKLQIFVFENTWIP